MHCLYSSKPVGRVKYSIRLSISPQQLKRKPVTPPLMFPQPKCCAEETRRGCDSEAILVLSPFERLLKRIPVPQ